MSSPACPNCGSTLVRRYCAECGQAAPRPDDYAVRTHLAEAFDQVVSVDGRALRTAGALIGSPGKLTTEHFAGHRARYLRPLQLFLVVNLLLFVAAPRMPMFSYSLENYLRYSPPSPGLVRRMTAPRGGDPAGARRFTESFDRRVESQRKGLIVLFAPGLALALRGMFGLRRRRDGVPTRFGEHLVFALHLLSFLWLVLAGWGLLARMASSIVALTGRTGMVAALFVLLLVTPAYLLLALRRVYRLGWVAAAIATLSIGAVFTGCLVLYRTLLFFTTFYTL